MKKSPEMEKLILARILSSISVKIVSGEHMHLDANALTKYRFIMQVVAVYWFTVLAWR